MRVRSCRPVFVSAQILRFAAMADFPNRIRELRLAKGWSQDTLAAAVGCVKNQISDLERGNRGLTLDWMRKVATALGVAPAELMTPNDNPLLLSDAERELIERFRSATPEQQENLARVTEALIPYRAPDKEEKAA